MSHLDKPARSEESEKTDSIEYQQLPSIPIEAKVIANRGAKNMNKFDNVSKGSTDHKDNDTVPIVTRPHSEFNKYYSQRKAYSAPKFSHHGAFSSTRTVQCYNLLYDKSSIPYIRKSKKQIDAKTRRSKCTTNSYEKLVSVKS